MAATELTNEEEPVHTEQVQDIIGTPPRWLYRWGITLVLTIALMCIIISTLINYPEAVQARIKIHSTNLPSDISFKDSVKLINILVQNDCMVKKGDSLATIENKAGKMVIKAPINGKLTYAGIIRENLQLSPNQHIFLISNGDGGVYGEMVILQNEADKVKPGQTVLIKLRNSADEKHNMLKGSIRYITSDPFKGDQYLAEVDFDQFKNNNGANHILLKNGMVADAQIITAKATLFHRLIQSLTKGVR